MPINTLTNRSVSFTTRHAFAGAPASAGAVTAASRIVKPSAASLTKTGTANNATVTTGLTTVFPEDFGAVGNGIANDHTALQNALNSLTATKVLSIRTGKVYNHSGVLTWSTPGAIIGPGRVHATVQTASAFKVTGTGSNQTLGDVEFSSVNTSRGDTLEHQKVAILGTGVTLNGTKISSSHAGGFFLYGATNCTLNNCVLTGSRADSYHNTFGTTGTRINNCTSANAGDDGFAVVSYIGDPAICSDIVITDCTVTSNGTRAFSIVGGSDIHYVNININGSQAAGLYIAAEASFNSYNVSNSTVTVGTIANANALVATEHGDILFFADGSGRSVNCAVTGVGAANGLITSSDTAAGWHIGGIAVNGGTCAGSVSNMRVTPNDGKTLSANLVGNSTISFSNIAYQ